jgi:hypothetical protein
LAVTAHRRLPLGQSIRIGAELDRRPEYLPSDGETTRALVSHGGALILLRVAAGYVV